MKRVLVTGARGFIGRHCLRSLLSSGYEVHAVSSKAPEKDRLNVQWHQADLLIPKQVSELVLRVEPSHLLHFAWYTVPGQYWTSPENCRWVEASLTLLRAFALAGGQRIVMAGTCAEYDWKYGYCSEVITPLLPKSLYGVCKNSLQALVDAFTRQLGLSAAWGRIFFLYGPYEHPGRIVPSVICSALRDEPICTSHGNQVRDFLYVQDVADAFVALLNSNVSGSVNIASGRPVVLRDIVYQVAKQLGRQDLIELGAVPTSANDPTLLVADVKRLFEEVDWQPQYNLDDGLERTIC